MISNRHLTFLGRSTSSNRIVILLLWLTYFTSVLATVSGSSTVETPTETANVMSQTTITLPATTVSNSTSAKLTDDSTTVFDSTTRTDNSNNTSIDGSSSTTGYIGNLTEYTDTALMEESENETTETIYSSISELTASPTAESNTYTGTGVIDETTSTAMTETTAEASLPTTLHTSYETDTTTTVASTTGYLILDKLINKCDI